MELTQHEFLRSRTDLAEDILRVGQNNTFFWLPWKEPTQNVNELLIVAACKNNQTLSFPVAARRAAILFHSCAGNIQAQQTDSFDEKVVRATNLRQIRKWCLCLSVSYAGFRWWAPASFRLKLPCIKTGPRPRSSTSTMRRAYSYSIRFVQMVNPSSSITPGISKELTFRLCGEHFSIRFVQMVNPFCRLPQKHPFDRTLGEHVPQHSFLRRKRQTLNPGGRKPLNFFSCG